MNTVDNKKENSVASPVASQAKAPARPMMHRPKPGMRPMRRGSDKPSDDIEQRIVDLARVTRVMAGGKRMKFRACMIIGDRKGRVGMGLAKGIDVSAAIAKAVTQARKHLTKVTIVDGTIPHAVTVKEKSARIMIRPAKKGSGIKAGGVVRIILDLAGIKDATAKILGAGNKINNSRATLKALSSFVPKSRSIKVKTGEVKKIVSADEIIVANKEK
ncbi:MAG: 30S ribosomal protein S5 [Patescibacteria group bacterium]|jgi:small subunit ribosomal protein S5